MISPRSHEDTRRLTESSNLFVTSCLRGSAFLLFWVFMSGAIAAPVKTALVQTDGKWQLLRDGNPYVIKGAAGGASKQMLAEVGGNSFRTWGAENLDVQL